MTDFLRVFLCFVMGLLIGAAAGYKHAPVVERVDCRPILEAADEILELEGTTNEHLKLMLRKYKECSTPEAENQPEEKR